MLMLSEAQMLVLINAGKTFEAELDDGSLSLCVEDYVPYVGTAIHAGHRLRQDLSECCQLSEAERLLEEDPYTDELIALFPITLVANDSRYEYDLNRCESDCLYEVAWDKPVWSRELTEDQKALSLEKHRRYYRILHALVAKLTSLFGNCLVLDVHSYNWKIRQYPMAPVFNIGTAQVDMPQWGHLIKRFEKNLNKMELPDMEVDARCDCVFQGRGYQATSLKQHFPEVLTLPLEVKKVFMNENTGMRYPHIIARLQQELYDAVLRLVKRAGRRLGAQQPNVANLVAATANPILSTSRRTPLSGRNPGRH